MASMNTMLQPGPKLMDINDGAAFPEFKRKLKNCLQKRKLTWTIPELGGKIPVPTEATHGATYEHQIIEGVAQAFGILSDAINAKDFAQMFPTEAANQELDDDPAKLFKALLIRSKGVVLVDASADNLTAFMSVTWATTTADGKSMGITAQAEDTMAKLIVCVEKSLKLEDADMKINEALACNRFLGLIPGNLKFGLHVSELKKLKTSVAMLEQVRGTIKDLGLEDGTATNPIALMMLQHQQPQPSLATPQGLQELATVLAAAFGKPPFGTDMAAKRPPKQQQQPKRPWVDRERKKNRELGAPNDYLNIWCDHCAMWGRHTSINHDHNYKPQRGRQHGGVAGAAPTTSTGTTTDAGTAKTLLAQLAQLANVPITLTAMSHDTYAELTKSALIAKGLADSSDAIIFVDCGAEVAICNNKLALVAGSFKAYPVPRTLAGVGTCKTIGTGLRKNYWNCGGQNYISFLEPVVYAPECPFQTHCTDDLGTAGLSTIIDSTTENNQLSLWAPKLWDGQPHRSFCHKYGKLWAAVQLRQHGLLCGVDPLAPTIHQMPQSAFIIPVLDSFNDYKQIPIPRALPTVTPSEFEMAPTTTSTMDAANFRARTGGMSERETRSLAKQLGVQLTSLHSKDAVHIDAEMRVANQSARRRIQSTTEHGFDDGWLHFASDTIGSKQPKSYFGNCFVKTWMELSTDSRKRLPYVTFSVGHTSLESVAELKQFVEASNFKYQVVSPSVTQRIRFHSDNGTEYRGDFRARLEADGIHCPEAVSNRKLNNKTYFIENANKQLEQLARANIRMASDNIQALGLTAVQFWDCAIAHAARQYRIVLRARNTDPGNQVERDTISALRKIEQPTYFGGPVTADLPIGSPQRKSNPAGKQFADRALQGIFLGMDRSEHYIVLYHNGEKPQVFVTNSITVGAHPQPPTTSSDIAWEALQFHDESPDQVPVVPPLEPPRAYVDKNGGPVSLHDRVTYPWSVTGRNGAMLKRLVDFPGTVTNIGNEQLTITYDDEPDEEHQYSPTKVSQWMSVTDGAPNPVIAEADDSAAELAGDIDDTGDVDIVTVARLCKPHASVAKFLDSHGQIRAAILDGTETIPPPPPQPRYTNTSAPTPPTSVKAALECTDALHWLHAIIVEYTTLYLTPAFQYVSVADSEQHRHGLKFTWQFVHKFGPDCNLNRFKARNCIAGWNLQKGVDFEESYVSAATPGDVKLFEALAIELNLKRYETDQENAYVQSDMPISPSKKPVIAAFTEGTRHFDSDGVEYNGHVVRALYGHGVSGWAHIRRLHGRLASDDCPLPLVQSQNQPNVFYCDFIPMDGPWDRVLYWLWINVDNVRHYSNDEATHFKFLQWYQSEFNITGGKVDLALLPPQKCIGMTFNYEVVDGVTTSVKLTMTDYITQYLDRHGLLDCNAARSPLPPGFMLSKEDKPLTTADETAAVEEFNKIFSRAHHQVATYKELTHEYLSMVQGANWISTMIGATLTTAVSILSRGNHYPSVVAVKALKQTLRYVKSLLNVGLTYVKHRDYAAGEYPRLEYGSDASFANHPDGKSQGGYTGRLVGQAVTTAVSGKSTAVHTSTTHAEEAWASECSRHAMYEVQLLHEIGIAVPLPVTHFMDNHAAILDAGSPVRRFSKRTKHFLVSEKYVQQCVEMGVTKLQHRRGDKFDTDAMTKSLTGVLLEQHASTLYSGELKDRG
jgi:hypothetical protein